MKPNPRTYKSGKKFPARWNTDGRYEPICITDPDAAIRTYAGYSEAELSGGKPYVIAK
jgi:hypothetical protein